MSSSLIQSRTTLRCLIQLLFSPRNLRKRPVREIAKPVIAPMIELWFDLTTPLGEHERERAKALGIADAEEKRADVDDFRL